MGRLEGNATAERLRLLRPVRNSLAHDMLLWWRINTNVGLTSHRAVADSLVKIEAEVRELKEEVSALADRNMVELGIDTADVQIPAGEMRRMMLGLDE